MTTLRLAATSALAAALLGGCASQRRTAPNAGDDESAHRAHEAYVAAINSNDLDTFLDMLTDDAVFMAPNSPRRVGKQAIREWAEPYLDAYHIHWDKTSLEFIITGDYAIEQYAYAEDDTPKAGGPQLQDTGKGLNIYRRCDDGVWRVARDAWNSDLPLPE